MIFKKLESAEDRYKEIEQQLLGAMVANGVKSWDAEVLKATYTPAGQTTTFDSARFKAEHPDLYKEYQKTSNRKEATLRFFPSPPV